GDGALRIDAGIVRGAGGSIASAGELSLTGEAIDLQGGTTQARRIAVEAGSLTTADGHLLSTGDDALQPRVRNTLDNDRGTLAANGALDLEAGALSNREGVLNAAGSDTTTIAVSGTLDNTDGTVATNADALDIAAGHLVNTRGAIQQSGTQGLHIATGRLDGNAGSIATAGVLTLSATDIAHREAVISATQVALTADSLDNTGGRIVATGAGANTLDVSATLDNTDGTLASNGDLSVAAQRLVNVGGIVQQAGEGELEIAAGTLDGEGGTLLSNGGLTITGETTDLTGGITSAQRIAIDTGDLTTAGGTLSATGTDTLVLHARGTLDNSGGSIGGNGELEIGAHALDNRQGSIVAAGSGPSRLDATTGKARCRSTAVPASRRATCTTPVATCWPPATPRWTWRSADFSTTATVAGWPRAETCLHPPKRWTTAMAVSNTPVTARCGSMPASCAVPAAASPARASCR